MVVIKLFEKVNKDLVESVINCSNIPGDNENTPNQKNFIEKSYRNGRGWKNFSLIENLST